MRIVGIGVDATEIARIVAIYERNSESFLARVYTPREREYCMAKKNFGESLAARWAAKEAVMKALGTGWAKGVAWNDIETINLPSGAPAIELKGGALQVARELGIVEWKISLTHTRTEAIAYVVAIGNDNLS